MKIHKVNAIRSFLFMLFLFAVFFTFAQPVPPPKDPDPPGTLVAPPGEPYNTSPLDGGLTILLTLGGVYILRQIFTLKTRDQKEG
jgi:hypothetical protein